MFGSTSKVGYREVAKGIKMKTLVYGERTLMTEFLLDRGALLQEHTHEHEQIGYLVRGRMRLHIGDSAKDIAHGDSWCVPSKVPHRAEILEDSVAIEVFSPCREEYLGFAHEADISE